MADLPEFLAVIGDYEMQRRQLIESNARLAAILRQLISGEILPADIDPETFEVTRPDP